MTLVLAVSGRRIDCWLPTVLQSSSAEDQPVRSVDTIPIDVQLMKMIPLSEQECSVGLAEMLLEARTRALRSEMPTWELIEWEFDQQWSAVEVLGYRHSLALAVQQRPELEDDPASLQVELAAQVHAGQGLAQTELQHSLLFSKVQALPGSQFPALTPKMQALLLAERPAPALVAFQDCS